MSFSIAEIASALSARAVGDVDLRVTSASEPAMASADQIAVALTPAYEAALGSGQARAALLAEGADWRALGLDAAVLVTSQRHAMADLSVLFDPGPGIAAGIHPTAVIADGARVGDGAAIGPFVHIADEAHIGAGARIGAHSAIGQGTVIGDGVLLHPRVTIGARVTIGDRFIAQSGAVIGADGFSFVPPEGLDIEGARKTVGQGYQPLGRGPAPWARTASLGTVEIGDDVEVGANSAIDRGTVRATRIGRGTKIDNLVQVGHNVEVGEDCLLCGQVGIAGSSVIGDRTVLSGKVGVGDNLTVGADVIAAVGALIVSNVPPGRMVMGSPAVRIETHVASYKALRRLPKLADRVAALQKAVSKRDRSD